MFKKAGCTAFSLSFFTHYESTTILFNRGQVVLRPPPHRHRPLPHVKSAVADPRAAAALLPPPPPPPRSHPRAPVATVPEVAVPEVAVRDAVAAAAAFDVGDL